MLPAPSLDAASTALLRSCSRLGTKGFLSQTYLSFMCVKRRFKGSCFTSRSLRVEDAGSAGYPGAQQGSER